MSISIHSFLWNGYGPDLQGPVHFIVFNGVCDKMLNASFRPFLKWPGGKFLLRKEIHGLLPEGKRLIEPFVGAGAIFLNTDYKNYLLSDINADLISLYEILKEQGASFIEDASLFFVNKNNHEKTYYEYRKEFNTTKDPYLKALLFLYLNRHGYNGLVRYNQQGLYNVPFGRYKKPYFPKEELYFFYEKSQRAVFICQDFRVTLQQAKKNDVVYCDPPYVPLSESSSFTKYSGKTFTLGDQEALAHLAKQLRHRGVHTLISNHHTPFTQRLYAGAQMHTLKVARLISCKINGRRPVKEVLAFFKKS